MKLNQINLRLVTFAVLTMGCLTASLAHTGVRQDQQQQSSVLGWLEGTVKNPDGKPIGAMGSYYLLSLRRTNGQEILNGEPNASQDGFYTMRNVPPGVHEFFVKSASMDGVQYAPIHIFGLDIEPGKRTELNIVMHPGTSMEEIGKPAFQTQKAIIVSDELARLQSEIEALKK